MATYNGGIDANAITFELEVGTPAVAYTEVHLVAPPAGDTTIAQSSTTTPNIPQFGIGTMATLRGKSIVVITNLDLTHIPAAQRQNTVSLVVHRSILAGGLAGDQVFTPKPGEIRSGPGYINAVITKVITIL